MNKQFNLFGEEIEETSQELKLVQEKCNVFIKEYVPYFLNHINGTNKEDKLKDYFSPGSFASLEEALEDSKRYLARTKTKNIDNTVPMRDKILNGIISISCYSKIEYNNQVYINITNTNYTIVNGTINAIPEK